MQKKIIFFSGAGISVPSGIKAFRDADGLWENHKIEDVCNFNTWKKNFELVHKFYYDRKYPPAKKILCNKEPSEYLPEHLFNKIYYESIEDAMVKIEDDISRWWE